MQQSKFERRKDYLKTLAYICVWGVLTVIALDMALDVLAYGGV